MTAARAAGPTRSRYPTALRHSQPTRSGSGAVATTLRWQCLYLRPDPHPHRSLRPAVDEAGRVNGSRLARSWAMVTERGQRRHKLAARRASPRSLKHQANRSTAGTLDPSASTASSRYCSADDQSPALSAAIAATSRATPRWADPSAASTSRDATPATSPPSPWSSKSSSVTRPSTSRSASPSSARPTRAASMVAGSVMS